MHHRTCLWCAVQCSAALRQAIYWQARPDAKLLSPLPTPPPPPPSKSHLENPPDCSSFSRSLLSSPSPLPLLRAGLIYPGACNICCRRQSIQSTLPGRSEITSSDDDRLRVTSSLCLGFLTRGFNLDFATVTTAPANACFLPRVLLLSLTQGKDFAAWLLEYCPSFEFAPAIPHAGLRVCLSSSKIRYVVTFGFRAVRSAS